MMLRAAEIDYGAPVPELTTKFLSVWSGHYSLIAALTDPKPPVLEIGAGYGILAAGLGERLKERVWTTEHPSRDYLYSRSYRQFLEDRGAFLVAHDLREGLPFRSGSFMTVYFCDVIEHLLPADIMKTLGEVSRVLRPEGELILSTPNLNRLSSLVRFLKGHSINPPLNVSKAGETFGHIRELAPKEVDRLLADFGLEPVKRLFGLNPYYTSEAFGDYNIFSPHQAAIINRITAVLFRAAASIGDGLYVLARRRLL
jgi:SAM-dependent methyltransferase